MAEALEDLHFAPHALLVPLDLLLRNGLQRDIARDVRRLGGVSADVWVVEEETENMDVAEGGLEEAVRWAAGGRAVRRSSRFHCSGDTCHVARCERR